MNGRVLDARGNPQRIMDEAAAAPRSVYVSRADAVARLRRATAAARGGGGDVAL